MKFGPVPVLDAIGAVLAHRTGALKKGRVLTSADVASLAASGIVHVVVAQIEADDMAENEAAATIAGCAGGVNANAQAAFAGRANLSAVVSGLIQVDAMRIATLNNIHESLTLATLQNFTRVNEKQLIATIKIIPFSAPKAVVQAAMNVISEQPLVSVVPFKKFTAGLIITQFPEGKLGLIAKAEAAMRMRIEGLGGVLSSVTVCDHTVAAVAHELNQQRDKNVDFVLLFGAAAIVDRGDVIPAAVVAVGGEVEHLGMPVDPGNLLMLANFNGKPVIGVPSCARSPKLNGFDWVLERLACGLVVTAQDIMAMGVGGLLAEISTRPSPRDGVVQAPSVTAIILAAGLSSRMGDNKLLADLNGKSIIRHTVERVLKSGIDDVIVVMGHQADAVQVALQGLAVQFVENPNYRDGLSSSLKVGVAAALQADAVLVCLGDMPCIDPNNVDLILAAFDPKQRRNIVVPMFGGEKGNPVLWGAAHFERLMAMCGDRGARNLLQSLQDEVVEVSVGDNGVLIDVDTLEALTDLRKRQIKPSVLKLT